MNANQFTSLFALEMNPDFFLFKLLKKVHRASKKRSEICSDRLKSRSYYVLFTGYSQNIVNFGGYSPINHEMPVKSAFRGSYAIKVILCPNKDL